MYWQMFLWLSGRQMNVDWWVNVCGINGEWMKRQTDGWEGGWIDEWVDDW